MEFNIGLTVIQISSTQIYSLFWAGIFGLSFNFTYWLFRRDRGPTSVVSKARTRMTVFIGTLLIVGTYGNTLAHKPFALSDCVLLAFVGAHGWMAEDFVNSFIKKVANKNDLDV